MDDLGRSDDFVGPPEPPSAFRTFFLRLVDDRFVTFVDVFDRLSVNFADQCDLSCVLGRPVVRCLGHGLLLLGIGGYLGGGGVLLRVIGRF